MPGFPGKPVIDPPFANHSGATNVLILPAFASLTMALPEFANGDSELTTEIDTVLTNGMKAFLG
jgi:hypothetical protein